MSNYGSSVWGHRHGSSSKALLYVEQPWLAVLPPFSERQRDLRRTSISDALRFSCAVLPILSSTREGLVEERVDIVAH